MITVFTPTYNRAYTLSRLYQSLESQTNLNFEWLIVDDGSTDSTKELIASFIKENKICIRYFYCENGGKQRAINKGVRLARGILFFIVDSDDFLTSNALESIYSVWDKIPDKEAYAGLCFRKMLAETGEILGGRFLQLEFDSNSLELAYRYKKNVDKAEVFQTSVLKRFPFPEIVNENFVPEALVWYRIAAMNLKLRCFDRGIYICEYLPDGLTNNFKLNLKKNSKGFALFYQELIQYREPAVFPYKLKAFLRLFQCYMYQLIRIVYLSH